MDLPSDWYVDHDGQRLVLDPEKVAAEIERLQGGADAATLRAKIVAILAPAIDARAPYAKVMIDEILKLVSHPAPGVSITPIELLALKKLAIVGNALADRLDSPSAKREQRALVKVLVDVIGRAELDNLAPAGPGAQQ